MRNTEKKTTSKKSKVWRGILIGICCLLAVILAIIIWGMSMLGMVGDLDKSQMSQSEYEEYLKNQEESIDPTFDGETISEEDALTDIPFEPLPHENVINIMLVGQDRREGQGRQRSDAMILCTINYADRTVSLTSFMRDMYVKIPGYSGNRMNACYQIGGADLLSSCLLENFGVTVDGTIEIDFGGFMNVIDTLGGIDMELTQAEANYLNRWGNWDVDDSTAGQWSLTEGMNHLTGEQALAYSRIRYIGNADFGRTERQRKVLMAVFEASKNKGVGDLIDLMYALLPLMATDMDDMALISFAYDAFNMMSDIEIETYRIPADGTFRDAVVNDMQVLVPDLEANRDVLKDILS